MNKETNINSNDLPENDIEIITGLKEYVKEMEPVLKNLDWHAKEADNSSQLLRALNCGTPEDKNFKISLNKAVADAREVIKKYEAGNITAGEAEKVQAQLENLVIDIIDEWEVPEYSKVREEFQCAMERKKQQE